MTRMRRGPALFGAAATTVGMIVLLGAALALMHLGQRAGSIAQALFVMSASVFSLPLLDDLISGEHSRMRPFLGSLGLPSAVLLMISAAVKDLGLFWAVLNARPAGGIEKPA